MVKTKNSLFFSPSFLVALTISLLVYSGLLPVSQRDRLVSFLPINEVEKIEGVIRNNPTKTSNGTYYSVQANTTLTSNKKAVSEAEGTVQLLIPTEMVEALYPGKLYSSQYNEAGQIVPIIENGLLFKADVQNINSYEDSSQKRQSYPLYIVKNIYQMGWVNNFAYIRTIMRLEFKRLLYAWGDAGGLLLALLSGAREYTNVDIAEGFRKAGLSHILALSGMHLSLFAGLALGGGKLIAGKRVGTIFSFFAVIVFVWFAGLSPSLFRAFVCNSIALLLSYCSLPGVSGNTEVIYRFISPSFTSIRLLRILSLSFIIHVCLFPQDMFTPAFMLSYGALVGIALSEYLIKPYIVRFLPQFLTSPLSAAIGAQLCTSPVTISLFGTLMPIGILSSVIVSPIALAFLVIGIFCILICIAIPFLLYPIGDIISGIYWFLEWIVLWFAQFPPILF